MKIKSVSGLTIYVKNLAKASEFYETLGFEIRKREANHATAYSNWFWIDLMAVSKETPPAYVKRAAGAERGAGILAYLSVDDVDAFHKYLVSEGLKPSGAPADWPSGNREFAIDDPDGYHLVIFKRR